MAIGLSGVTSPRIPACFGWIGHSSALQDWKFDIAVNINAINDVDVGGSKTSDL